MAQLDWTELDQRAVDTARVLAADAVEKVGNGHPGTAMSLAPAAYLLYQHVLQRDPADPDWLGRDRFILSVGHSSLTQYVQLYLTGELELHDLETLRTWGSKTPGHPEYGHTAGVEITTGPLGQGLASAVGFAYAQRFERQLFDPDTAEGESAFDHYTYVIAGDGDLQEGVTSEASSLAGHQELGRLIVLYDANQISIEDDTDISFTEDVQARYESYGWHVQTVEWRTHEGYHEDIQALNAAIDAAKADLSRPSIVILKTIIGWPAPTKQNTGKIHGSKLGGEELAAVKAVLGFNAEEHFAVAPEVIEHTRDAARRRGQQARADWQSRYDAWAAANPERKALLDRLLAGELPDLDEVLPTFEGGTEISTRAASGKVINALAGALPELWGGSADLAESNNTTIEGGRSFVPAQFATKEWPEASPGGRILHFGIREHAMAAILNGIVLHGPTRPFGGTFLIFSDYQRPALRLAALMNVHPIFVWTHDSIALGEDGPTHQPIEQLSTLRLIPNFEVVRPSDANEVAVAWKTILGRSKAPVGIALTRQNLPVLTRGTGAATETELASAELLARGAYVLAEAQGGTPEVIIVGTGSEVQLALEARERLQADGIATRVVAAPSLEWFREQDEAYRESVLPSSVTARVSVEAGSTPLWKTIVGDRGRSVGIDHFGASASYQVLFEQFGITTDAVVQAAHDTLAAHQPETRQH